MSSYRTHALIGAVGGLGLARLLDMVPHATAISQNPFAQLGPASIVPPGVTASLTTAGLVAGSAFLALLSDIDEPGSFIARRAKTAIVLACAPLLGAVGWFLASSGVIHTQPIVAAVVCALVGLGFFGPLLGHVIVRLVRVGAGGHRRLTHSLVPCAALAVLAAGLWFTGLRPWAIIPAALVWGVVLHGLGDLPTPAGLPLFYPLSQADFHSLPKPLRPYGEPIAAAVAVVAGFLLWPR